MPSIAIIPGTGNMGLGLARLFARNGHSVGIGSRDPEKAKQAASKILSEEPKLSIKGGNSYELASEAEYIIWAISGPLAERHEYLKTFEKQFANKVVIDITNLKGSDPNISTVEQDSKILPEAKWTSAFKIIWAKALLDPAPKGIPRDVQVCGDDREVRKKVVDLINTTGFRALNCGPLRFARVDETILEWIIWAEYNPESDLQNKGTLSTIRYM